MNDKDFQHIASPNSVPLPLELRQVVSELLAFLIESEQSLRDDGSGYSGQSDE
ncbi:MAG: hypothetical protein QY326_00460 [Bdellovibrionota bacterium]|nr:MAG: hypothetical protein QY326_00460 [Bdellovibrionota bacterium]